MGNKDDFDSTGKVVSTDDAKQYARQMNITLFETSAKDNRNIQEAFYAITRLALQQRLNAHKTNPTIDYRNGREIDSQFIQIKPSKKKRHRKSCCK